MKSEARGQGAEAWIIDMSPEGLCPGQARLLCEWGFDVARQSRPSALEVEDRIMGRWRPQIRLVLIVCGRADATDPAHLDRECEYAPIDVARDAERHGKSVVIVGDISGVEDAPTLPDAAAEPAPEDDGEITAPGKRDHRMAMLGYPLTMGDLRKAVDALCADVCRAA